MTKSGIEVSVCCITYNHAPYIRKCIEGVLKQETSFGVELLIHDDASDDGTTAIIQEYAQRYPDFIKLYIQPVNLYSQGCRGINLKYNISRAAGNYIALCEGDDYWTDPYKLEKQVTVMKAHPEAVFSFHAARTENTAGQFGMYYKPDWLKKSGFIDNHLLVSEGGGGYCTASAVFKKEVFNNPPSFLINCEVGDLALAWLAAARGNILYLDEEMAVYRTGHPGSWTRRQTPQSRLKIHRNIVDTAISFNEQTGSRFHKSIKKFLRKEYLLAAELSIIAYPVSAFFKIMKKYAPKVGLLRTPRLFRILLYKIKKGRLAT